MLGLLRPLWLCLPEAWAEICLMSRGSILPSGLSPMSPHSCSLSPAAQMLVMPLALDALNSHMWDVFPVA